MSWILKMAWRDSRGSRRQLLLFLSSMVVGVAALVAIKSFGDNLEQAVNEESKSLLGADLSFESDRPFSTEAEALIDSLGGEQSRQISFTSMALFPETGGTRLSTIRALEGGYPYYGVIETTPAEAASTYLESGGALVDATLMHQFGLRAGDSVRVGGRTYPIQGRIDRTPRETEIFSLFSPRIYIPLNDLDQDLLGPGSRAEYEVFFRFEPGRDAEALVDELEPRLREMDIGFDTIEEEREDWGESLTNLYRFLSVVAFLALLLGGIGVASAVHVYVRRRFETIAVLRCLGAESRKTFAVYLVQAITMGLAGGVAGAAIGVGIQSVVPLVLGAFLPFEVSFRLAWPAIFAGIGMGVALTVVFALLPLVGIRRISPLLTLRVSVENVPSSVKDPAWWLVMFLIAAAMTAFAVTNAPEPVVGLGYTLGLAAVFLALAAVARLIIFGTRHLFPSGWPYTWRQGLANLYRPNNQTGTLMLALGLGTFLIATLFGVQRTLLSQIEIAGGAERPNLVFFDIQSDQIDGVSEIVRAHNLPVLDRVPIVTMRLAEVKGRSIDEIRADSTVDVRWAHMREYRSTYRDYLIESEEVVEGDFVGTASDEAGIVPVSVEREIAAELGVGIGDTLLFDVQGMPVRSMVGSIREVDWRRIGTNFFVVFPTGVLEEAPQFHVLLSRTASAEESASIQRAVVQAYPSISAIDLGLVLSTFDAIFSRISFVVRFMASFSIVTGLIVLVSAVVVSRVQRTRESVLLKTLGASQKQVLSIMTSEYLFLGFFAALTGLVLSLASGWTLARFVFDTDFRPDVWAMLGVLLAVPLLTIIIGLVTSRGVYARPPLDIIRAEV